MSFSWRLAASVCFGVCGRGVGFDCSDAVIVDAELDMVAILCASSGTPALMGVNFGNVTDEMKQARRMAILSIYILMACSGKHSLRRALSTPTKQWNHPPPRSITLCRMTRMKLPRGQTRSNVARNSCPAVEPQPYFAKLCRSRKDHQMAQYAWI